MLAFNTFQRIGGGLAWMKSSTADVQVTPPPPGVLVDQPSRIKEKGSSSEEMALENTSNQQMTLSSVHVNILHFWHLGNSAKHSL